MIRSTNLPVYGLKVFSNARDLANMSIVGVSGSASLIVDTLPPNLLRGLSGWLDETSQHVIVLHNHCHLDHVEGDLHFQDATVVLFGKQPQMLAAEMQRFPDRLTPPPFLFRPCGVHQFAGQRVATMEAPGHSLDCLLIHLPDLGVVFGGENVANGTQGRCCIPHLSNTGDVMHMFEAIEHIAGLRCECIVPAHGDPVVERRAIDRMLGDNRVYLERLLQHLERAPLDSHALTNPPPIETLIQYTPDRYMPVSSAFHRKNWRYSLTNRARKEVKGRTDEEALLHLRAVFDCAASGQNTPAGGR